MKFTSPIISDARGKVGGAVYSKNRSGNYIREKKAPTQPRTPAQLAVRSDFTANSKAWKGLTDTQRAGWSALATQVISHDSLGNSYKPTGQQLYVGCNATLAAIGQPPINTAPATVDTVIGVGSVTLVASAAGSPTPAAVMTVTVGTNTETQSLLIKATPAGSQGKNFYGPSTYRLIDAPFHPTSATTNILADYEAKYGALVTGQKLSITVTPVTDNGFQGTPLRADVTVVAPTMAALAGEERATRTRRSATAAPDQAGSNGENNESSDQSG